MGPLESRIRSRLSDALSPTVLDLVNESHMHSGPATESHFNLVIVSPAFEGLRLVRRHRLVYQALGQELEQGLHALTLKTLTPDEASAQGVTAVKSPPCLGASKGG